MARKKAPGPARYKNFEFLQQLGTHCERLREQKGLSMARMAKESDGLSSSVIHRLETGAGAVNVTGLFRYAEVLGLPVKALLDFEFKSESARIPFRIATVPADEAKRDAYKTLLPLYSLKAAAGYFGRSDSIRELGWVKVTGPQLDKNMFVVQAVGESMESKIHDQDYLVMRANPAGTRQGKIVLAEYKGPADPETGGSYTVKKYNSMKFGPGDEWRHREIRLEPLNHDFKAIVLHAKDEDDFRIVAECVGVLKSDGSLRLI